MTAQPRMPRFYGGHYDSVKQLAYRDFLLENGELTWHADLVRRYTARLRLDVLMAGNVILTDAQFYDGLLFHGLVATEASRTDFYNFLRQAKERFDAPLIEVRRRQSGLLEMFSKPLIFSSVVTAQAKDQVAAAMKKALDRAREQGVVYARWTDLLADVLALLDTTPTRDRFAEVIERLKLLDAAPKEIFRDWEPNRVKAYPQLLKIAKEEMRFTVPRTGNCEIDETLQRVQREMEKDFPNRSHIEQFIRHCKESDPRDQSRRKLLDGVWTQVLRVYNRAIANQHSCVSIDLGETPLSPKDTGEIIDNLSPATLGAIADQSWGDFWKHLTSGHLAKPWKRWRDVLSQPGEYSRTHVLKSLLDLVRSIQKTYRVGHTIDALVAGGSSTLTHSADGFSISIDPVKLISGVTLAAKRTITGLRERLNLIRHGLAITHL